MKTLDHLKVQFSHAYIYSPFLTNFFDPYDFRYFENNPKKQSLFKRFSNVPFHQLNSKNAFIAQATLVMSALDDIVMSVDNPPAMKNKMIQLGRYHRMIKAKAKVVDFLVRGNCKKILDEYFKIEYI